MNAAKAKRRWLAWCRYVAATQTHSNRSMGYDDVHEGQVKAYHDHMHAGRFYPPGLRVPYYPGWAHPRG